MLGVLVTLGSVQILRPPRFRPDNDVAISMLGYTNQSNTCMAVFQVTNRTAVAYICLVGGRVSEASRGGRPVFHDLNAPASPGVLKPRATLTFLVPAAADTNDLRVSVQLQELRTPRPKWQAAFAPTLRLIGIRALEPNNHHLTSPPFSRPGS